MLRADLEHRLRRWLKVSPEVAVAVRASGRKKAIPRSRVTGQP